MAREVKCPICSTMNDKKDTEEINRRFYCLECAEEKKRKSLLRKTDWDELFEYICELYNIEKPTGMMFKQLSDFRKEPYNYTDKGMYLTLKYFYETEENEVLENTGLGIIPWCYEKAKNEYEEVKDVKRYMEDFELTEVTKIIKIKPFQETYKKSKTLSFDGILGKGGVHEQDD